VNGEDFFLNFTFVCAQVLHWSW